MLMLPKEAEDKCPHCPYREPGPFIEFMYRQDQGSWDQLSDYVDRLRIYRGLAASCNEWVRQMVAKLCCIPPQHIERYKENLD